MINMDSGLKCYTYNLILIHLAQNENDTVTSDYLRK